MPSSVDFGNEGLPVSGANKGVTVKPAELGLDSFTAMEAAGHEKRACLAKTDQAEVKRLVVERTEAKSVLYGVRPLVGVPMDVSGLQPDGSAIKPSVETTDRTLVAIGAENQLSKRPISGTSNPNDDRWIEIESDGRQDALVQAGRKMGVKHLMPEFTHEIGIRP